MTQSNNLYSTAGIDGAKSIEAWRQAMAEVYYRLDIKSAHADRLRGELVDWQSDTMGVSSFKADAQRVIRRKEAAKADKTRDYKGGKVYFCCDNCPKKFDADQKAFASKANAQLVQTGQAKQGKCPISGQDVNKEKELTVAGAKVNFCCDMCKGKVEKASDEDKMKLVFSDEAWKKADFKVEKKK